MHGYNDINERSFDLTSVKQLTNELLNTSKIWNKFSQNPIALKSVVNKLLDWMSNTVGKSLLFCFHFVYGKFLHDCFLKEKKNHTNI